MNNKIRILNLFIKIMKTIYNNESRKFRIHKHRVILSQLLDKLVIFKSILMILFFLKILDKFFLSFVK